MPKKRRNPKSQKRGRSPQRRAISRKETLEQLHFIRPFISFKVKTRKLIKRGRRKKYQPLLLTRRQKDKIAKYFDELTSLTMRSHAVYKSRDKAKLAKAQIAGKHDPDLSELKVAIIPTSDPHARMLFDEKGNFHVQAVHLGKAHSYFNMRALARDPDAEINRALANLPEGSRFQTMAGDKMIDLSYDRRHIKAAIKRLMDRYSPVAVHERGDHKTHVAKNWLFGITATEFKRQKSSKAAKADYRRKAKKLRRRKPSSGHARRK